MDQLSGDIPRQLIHQFAESLLNKEHHTPLCSRESLEKVAKWAELVILGKAHYTSISSQEAS